MESNPRVEKALITTYKWYLNFKIENFLHRCETDTNNSLEITF